MARSGPVTLSDPSKVDKSPGSARDTVVVVDNYDSFTYNLCQVRWGGLFIDVWVARGVGASNKRWGLA